MREKREIIDKPAVRHTVMEENRERQKDKKSNIEILKYSWKNKMSKSPKD